MKKATSLKKLALKTETISILTDLGGVHGAFGTSTLVTVGTGPLVSQIKTCKDTCYTCVPTTTFCMTQ
jgi:hypothetical protein